MDVYTKDGTEFSPEYLAYLRTLTSSVHEGRVRLTRNEKGELVRVEVWPDDGTGVSFYFDIPLAGWMKT